MLEINYKEMPTVRNRTKQKDDVTAISINIHMRKAPKTVKHRQTKPNNSSSIVIHYQTKRSIETQTPVQYYSEPTSRILPKVFPKVLPGSLPQHSFYSSPRAIVAGRTTLPPQSMSRPMQAAVAVQPTLQSKIKISTTPSVRIQEDQAQVKDSLPTSLESTRAEREQIAIRSLMELGNSRNIARSSDNGGRTR